MRHFSHHFLMIATVLLLACGGRETSQQETKTAPAGQTEKEKVSEAPGMIKASDIQLNDPLEKPMIDQGRIIYEMKCAACHKLTDQQVVGPGFAGITNRRKPEWIMNMITNVDMMLDSDPEAQKLLEECLTRMPNQGVSAEESRNILEFLRQNDLDQTQEKDKGINP
jgi:cytochrome c5